MRIPYDPATNRIGGDFSWAQDPFVQAIEDQYNAGKPVRIIVLKARQLGFCLAPDTKVLTAALTWTPISELLPGDELVSVDEEPSGGRGGPRKMRRAVVEARRVVREQAYRLVLENGETVVATGPHRFLCRRRGGTNADWRSVDSMRVGDSVRFVTKTWGAPDYEDGWFGGLLDGEGSCRPKPRGGAEVCASQVYGPVYDRMVRYLKERGYTFREELADERPPGLTSKFGHQPLGRVTVNRMNELFRLIGQTRPSRFLDRYWWEGKELPGKRSGVAWTRVMALEPVGVRKMIDLQTSTRTFIAEGLVSHNSTITEGVVFNWLFIHPGTHALTLAHDSDVSVELFAKAKTYWEKWPLAPAYHLKYDTKQNMQWVETASQLKIATAGNNLSGRGHTLHAVHLSEVAHYPDPKKLMLGLMNSVPEEHGTIMVVESTANGIGNYFYNMWNDAVDGGSDYIPLFFPWWKHPEYRKATTLSTGTELSAEEKQLRKMMRDAAYPDGRIYECLHWRRWMLRNKVADENEFMQEYPSTPEEAFRMSGTPVFPEQKLRDAFHDRDNCACHGGLRGYLVENLSEGKVKFYKDRAGPVRIFKLPSKRDRSPFRYFLGADPAETVYGDLASIQVISRDPRKPIEQMASFSARTDGPQLAIEIMKMGRFYNSCMVCPEAEGGGQACIQRILDSGYPMVWLHTWADKAPGKKSSSYGFSMNWNRKKWCVSVMQNRLFNDQVVLHDQLTYSQFLDYAYWDNGEMGNASPDGHDDAVMAFIIAVLASSTEQTYLPDAAEGSAHPILDIYSPSNLALEGI